MAAVAVAAVLLLTAPMLPMVWDEGDAIVRAAEIPRAWPYTTAEEGHPAFYGMVIAASEAFTGRLLPPLTAARCGPILLFALAAGAMYYRLRRDTSRVAACGAVAALLLMPRVFAHAHFASFDGPLTSCWILAWAAFRVGQTPSSVGKNVAQTPSSVGKNTPPFVLPAAGLWTAILFGIALGMTMSCKATGWLAIVPFAAVAIAYRDRAALRTLAIGLPLAGLTFFALNPPLWSEPIHGLLTFLRLNFDRGAQPGLNISTQFFGRMYNLDFPIPWYNAWVWTAITVPVGVLAVAMLGVWTAARGWRGDARAMLVLANWLILLVVRAIPGVPPHDAERLILPSFAFLAVLSGMGCDALVRRAGRWAWPLLAAAGVGGLSSLVWYAPQWLSYYNLLIGGLPGATALGMEPTYYWDGLDANTLAWLNDHTGPGEKAAFAAAPEDNLRLLRRWGLLRVETDDDAPGTFRWYVLQRRPSGMQPADVWLTEHARPVYVKRIRDGGRGPWRLDAPLVEVYDYADYRRAEQAQAPAGGTR